MLKRNELLKTPEYWVETLQNQIYREVVDFMEFEGLTRSQLAQKLGVSKGYITQILSGECNFSLKKLVELSLKMEVAPMVTYVKISDYDQRVELSNANEDLFKIFENFENRTRRNVFIENSMHSVMEPKSFDNLALSKNESTYVLAA